MAARSSPRTRCSTRMVRAPERQSHLFIFLTRPLSAGDVLYRFRRSRQLSNRERTVTTLTEDPNTPFLVPTTTEDNPMSSPFSVASSSAPQQPHFYGFAFNPYVHHGQAHPSFYPAAQQRHHHPAAVLPLGQSDLEILQLLKKSIKDGQHDFYRAVPQPAVLARRASHPLVPICSLTGHQHGRRRKSVLAASPGPRSLPLESFDSEPVVLPHQAGLDLTPPPPTARR